MKKFYYKKEDTVIDKAPTVLERRNTLSQDGNMKDEVKSRLSTRTSSLGSLLKDDSSSSSSLLPRVQGGREITKSLSEDVLGRGYAKNPGSKVITERELAASRLYKIRKASINSKSSPQKAKQKDDASPTSLKDPKFKPVPLPTKKDRRNTDTSCLFSQRASQKGDLSPVTLKDPKFKPVPVQPKNSSKKESSCLCYLAIFLAISLCTIGVLAAVTGILYGELFSDKNSTSRRLKEAVIDIINLVEDNSSIHEYRVLSGGTLAKVSFESDDSREIRRSGSNLMESGDINEFRQMDMTDLSRLLDSKDAEIKFQDRDTTIFEVNTSSSAEQKSSIDNIEIIKEETKADIVISEADGPNILNAEHASDESSIIENEKLDETGSPSSLDKMGQRENGGAITNSEQEIRDHSTDIEQTQAVHVRNSVREMEVPEFDSEKLEIDDYRTVNTTKQETDSLETMKKENEENDGSEYTIREVSEVSDEVYEENKYTDGLLNSEFNAGKDFSGLDLTSDVVNVSDKKASDEQDHSISSASGTKLENQPVILTENTDAVILTDKNISKPSVKLNYINLEYQTKTVSLPKDKVVWKAGDSLKVSNANNESELVGTEISSENLGADASDKTEHDVEAMLEVVSEPADDPFTVNRNGDIDQSEASNLGMTHNFDFFNAKSGVGDSSAPLRTELQNPREDQMPKEAVRAKPLNMKVSLAEAMKHLQTIDVKNKIMTSRMKSPKPTVQRVKPPKPNDKPRKKENISMDRMQYLHNLRLALQGNLIRL